MLRNLKTGIFKQRYFRTFSSLKSRGRPCECKTEVKINFAVRFPYQSSCFSVKAPSTEAIPYVDKEKFSDSDSDDESKKKADILNDIISNGKSLSSEEWERVKTEAFESARIINSYNIDAIILGCCLRHKNLNMGKSYLEHLSTIGKKPNMATIANFFRLCYYCQESGVSEKVLLSLYDELRSKYPLFEAMVSENLALGLCLTSRWREAVELLDMAKLSSIPGSTEYSAVIKTAIDNNDIKLAMKLIHEMLLNRRRIRPEVFHSWLDYTVRISKNKNERWRMIEEILQLIIENDLKPTLDIVQRLKGYYEETSTPKNVKKASLTTISGRGECEACQGFLKPIKISRNQFEVLRSSFMDRVVIGKDVFRKSTPVEVEEFKEFIKNTAPYDIVIDGLNIALAGSNSKKFGSKNHADTLQLVVKHFVSKSQKILVLGRKHMRSWKKTPMDYLYKNATVFLADNVSQDDPFLLYAALYSGLGTNFLSRDLMRGHAFLLQNVDLRSTFRLWQLQHQYQLKYVTQDGKVVLKFPFKFNPMAQRSVDGAWHIPYEMEFDTNPPVVFEAPSSWLCLS